MRFDAMNVVIGPNGCGKSSLLQSIDFLKAFFRSSVEIYLTERGWNYLDLPNLRQAGKAISWQVRATLPADEDGEGAGEYLYAVTLQPQRYLGVASEELHYQPAGADDSIVIFQRKGTECTLRDRRSGHMETIRMVNLPASIMSTWDPARDRHQFPEALRFRTWVERFRSFLIWDPKVLRHPDRGRHHELGRSGEHLAAVVGHMKDKQPEQFKQLVKRMRRLFPQMSNLSVSGKGWGWRTIQLHESNGKEIVYNSEQMSDGVLRLLAIASLLYAESPPPVLMLEEPENGVHPQLIREVVQLLRELTLRKPPRNCQVFFTTHSPYVLDEFFDHPEQVYCMDRPGPQAGARIVRLSDNKQLNLAKSLYDKSLGEAWVTGLLGATAGGSQR